MLILDIQIIICLHDLRLIPVHYNNMHQLKLNMFVLTIFISYCNYDYGLDYHNTYQLEINIVLLKDVYNCATEE